MSGNVRNQPTGTDVPQIGPDSSKLGPLQTTTCFSITRDKAEVRINYRAENDRCVPLWKHSQLESRLEEKPEKIKIIDKYV